MPTFEPRCLATTIGGQRVLSLLRDLSHSLRAQHRLAGDSDGA
ncbi:MAG: hypothetical protein ACK2US_12160 [Anaerolineae bacterium]|jgi:hypothetical protein